MIDVKQKKAELYAFLAELEQDIEVLQNNIAKVKEDIKDINSEEELIAFSDEADIEYGLNHIELYTNGGGCMTLDKAIEWLQHHADNTPMPGAREAYRTILEALRQTNKATCNNCAYRHEGSEHNER